MLISYIRSSSLANYDFCEQQYFLTYVLGFERKAGQKAEKGTIFHKVMECLALLKLQSTLSDNPILSIVEDNVISIEIPREHLMELSTAEGVLNKVFEYYTGKSEYGYSQKDFRDIASWMYDVLTYSKGIFDPRNRNVLAVEQKFDLPIEEEWAKIKFDADGKEMDGQLCIKGTIDFLTKLDEDTIEIIDWKTGKRYDWAAGKEKTYDDLCKDRQLMLYYYAAKRLYPNVKNVLLTIYFINDGGPFTIAFEPKNMLEVENFLHKAYKNIRSNNMPRMISTSQTSFKCTKLCDYYKNIHPNAKNGENICQFIHNETKRLGISAVTKKYSQQGHDVNFYQNPGN